MYTGAITTVGWIVAIGVLALSILTGMAIGIEVALRRLTQAIEDQDLEAEQGDNQQESNMDFAEDQGSCMDTEHDVSFASVKAMERADGSLEARRCQQNLLGELCQVAASAMAAMQAIEWGVTNLAVRPPEAAPGSGRTMFQMVADDVYFERTRQEFQWGNQGDHSVSTWLEIIGEELGECCTASLELKVAQKKAGWKA